MSEFTIDFGGLVAPSVPAGAQALSLGVTRPTDRFENHLGQASRPRRDTSQDRQHDRSANDASAPVGPTRTESSSQSADPSRETDRIDETRAADDTASQETTGDSPENDNDHGSVSPEEASTVVSANESAALAKSNTKRRAANSDENPVEKAAIAKAKSKAKSKHGNAGNQQVKAGASTDATANEPTDQTGDPKSAAEKTLKDRVSAEQPVSDATERAAPGDTDASGDDGANQSHESPANSLVQATASQKSSDGSSKQIQATAAAPGAQSVDASENADPTNPSGSSGPKRTRAQKAGDLSSATQPRDAANRETNQSTTASTPADAAKVAADLATAVEPAAKDQSKTDAAASTSNEISESRLGSAPALLAARQDKAHEPTGRPEGLTESERVRFVQRVARAFHSIGDEGGEVRLRLSPPELGSLRLELTVREGVMTARLETETTTARSLLLDNLPVLRDRLAEQNIKVERFDVDVRDENRDRSADHFADQPGTPQQGQRQRPRAYEPPATQTRTERISRTGGKRDGTSELNVVI
jgi:flagellar hook-length control protein FliK